MSVTLETGTSFISIILKIVVKFQHETLLNRSMSHIGKDVFANHVGLLLFERGSTYIHTHIHTCQGFRQCRTSEGLFVVRFRPKNYLCFH